MEFNAKDDELSYGGIDAKHRLFFDAPAAAGIRKQQAFVKVPGWLGGKLLRLRCGNLSSPGRSLAYFPPAMAFGGDAY